MINLKLILLCRNSHHTKMSKLPPSLTNVTPKETLQQHPSFGRYIVDRINIYAAPKGSNEPPHWKSNWIFRPAGSFDSGVRSLKLNPTMEPRDEGDTRSAFEVSLAPGVGPAEGQMGNKLISLKSPMSLAELLDELELNGLFDYEPIIETKGSLWWQYGLISWLEHKGYLMAGSTSDFLQWLAILRANSKAGSGGSSHGASDIDLFLSTRGNFTRGEHQAVHLPLG